MQVAEGIHRLGSRYINWYLIEEGGRLTVLDTGLPGYWRQLASELQLTGRSPRDIAAVLFTHYHVDHTGTAARIHAESEAPVWVHGGDAGYVRGEKARHRPSIPFFKPWWMRYLPHLVRNGAAGYHAVAELSTFADGETLDVPGRPRVIHAPGHTPGNCALYLEPRRVLFSGDVLVTLDTATGQRRPACVRRHLQCRQPSGGRFAVSAGGGRRSADAARPRRALARRGG